SSPAPTIGSSFPKRAKLSPIPAAARAIEPEIFRSLNFFSTLAVLVLARFCGRVICDGCIREPQLRRTSCFHVSEFRSFPVGPFLYRSRRRDAIRRRRLASL